MIAVRVRHLPRDSAVRRVFNDGRPEWGDVEFLLSDIWAATAGAKDPHPARPQPQQAGQVSPERKKAIAKARRLAKKRREDIGSGLIT